MLEHSLQPYNEGYRAYFDQQPKGSNPYSYGSSEYDEWEAGWLTAEQDDDIASSDGYDADDEDISNWIGVDTFDEDDEF